MATSDPQLSTVTPWHIGRGWPAADLRAALAALADRPCSYPVEAVEAVNAVSDSGWTVERFREHLGQEPPGPPQPDGFYAQVRAGIEGYRFGHPALTEASFDPESPLLGRDLLILIRVVFVRLLVGLRIGAVRETTSDSETRFGIRMDTLAGHILHGSEWVQVIKDHRTGAVMMEIDVRWRPAQLPTWWMALGFRLFGRTFQQRWRRLAARRLQRLGQLGQAGRMGEPARVTEAQRSANLSA